MNTVFYTTLVIILGIVHALHAADTQIADSITEETIYDAISSKCTSLNKTTNFPKDEVLKSCPNWSLIKNTTNISDKNKAEVRCLIFYNRITEFCTKTNNSQQLDVKFDSNDLVIEKFCSNFSISTPQLKDLSDSKAACIVLCYDFDTKVNLICSLAQFYTDFKIPILPSEKADLDNKNQPIISEGTVEITVDVQPVEPKEANKSITKDTNPAVTSGKHSSVEKIVENTRKTKPDLNETKPKVEFAKNVKPVTKSITPTETSVPVVVIEEKTKQPASKQPENTIKVEQENTHLENTEQETADDLDTLGEEQKMQMNEEDDKNNSFDDDLQDEGDKGEPEIHEKPILTVDNPSNDDVIDEMNGDSYFFSYFSVIICVFIAGYVGYHNRQKILALILEGNRGRRHQRSGRRPNSSNYHKLDSNLEEAISSSCTKNTTQVIY